MIKPGKKNSKAVVTLKNALFTMKISFAKTQPKNQAAAIDLSSNKENDRLAMLSEYNPAYE